MSQKTLTSLDGLKKIMKRMGEFPPIHNTYREDGELIISQMDLNIDDEKKYQSYYRSIITIFFSIIEADIFYYNQFDPYLNYSDRHSFKEKFEKTFPKVCQTWSRQQLQEEYFSKNSTTIHKLRNVRNNLAHPKALEHLYKASWEDVEELKGAFKNYNEFIKDLMTNFMFQLPVLPTIDIIEALKVISGGQVREA